MKPFLLRSNSALARFARLGVLAAIGLLGSMACAPTPPNVILVVVDTLRQDRVSAYGYERQTTPNLDRLASEGALFDGLSPTSWTKPATASLLTGLHPLRHQTFARGDVLPESVTTLAQILAGRGYSTVAVSANSWISRAWGFERGFEHFHLMKNEGYGHQAKADQVARVARANFSQLKSPYFLYLHLVDPHAPYDPPAAWDGSPLSPALAAQRPLSDQTLFSHSFRSRPPELMRALVDLYDGEVHQVDTELGSLLAELAKRSPDRGTILVVTADHGEELGDHGRIGHGHTLYHETTAVPLILRAPGRVPAGLRLGKASLMDVVPTVLELAGLGDETTKLGTLDGHSLVPRLRSSAEPDIGRESYLLHLDFDSGHGLAWITGERKLMLSIAPYSKAVFDLATDPGERRNLFSGLPQTERAQLAFELARNYNQISRDALPRRTTTLDEALAASIAALGYVSHANDRGDARLLPARIRPADTSPGGLRGLEGDALFESCLALGLASADAQLLDGWFTAERQEGRWTGPRAVAALAVPPSPRGHRLRIEGTSYRTNRFSLQVNAGQRILMTIEDVPPGLFAATAVLEPPFEGDGPLLLELTVAPPFVPAQHMRSADERVLGAFLTRLCLEAL